MEDFYFSADFREKREMIFSQFRSSMDQFYLEMFTLDFDDLNNRLLIIVKRTLENIGSDECSKLLVMCSINSFLLQEAIRRNMNSSIIRDYWDRFEFYDINEDINFLSTRLIFTKYLIEQCDFKYAKSITQYLRDHLENDEDKVNSSRNVLHSLVAIIDENINKWSDNNCI